MIGRRVNWFVGCFNLYLVWVRLRWYKIAEDPKQRWHMSEFVDSHIKTSLFQAFHLLTKHSRNTNEPYGDSSIFASTHSLATFTELRLRPPTSKLFPSHHYIGYTRGRLISLASNTYFCGRVDIQRNPQCPQRQFSPSPQNAPRHWIWTPISSNPPLQMKGS